MSIAVLPRRGFLPSFSLGKPGQFLKRYGLFSLFLLTLSAMATAGTDTTFDGIYMAISWWVRLFAIATLISGIAIGLVRQSVMAIVIGIGVALVMFYGSGIIDGIVTFAI